jgi:cytochrome c oxidase subunit 2
MLQLTLAAAALAGGSVATYVVAQPRERVIRIEAKRFDYTPGELTLKKGEPVVLEFSSRDVLMGFNLPDFNVRADIVPGKTARVPLTPDKAGTFTFLCDVFCGEGHETMNGTLVVT